ncbi:LysR family transcriptional regulator [uncultured Pelagimonas sp.]|uniref:LysR family transcriptional regulator n=1 Tax=uncultured Pelagimonas sp. TaxID=1618102 RepID=UPI002612650E|nr:LysR family transcriptional regulator [uncultured Pelagimonas sp.]
MADTIPSLKWFTTFRTLAQSGSVQLAAAQTRQSDSTVSHHLQCLEKHLGTALFDHSCRPMQLTAQGAVYLRYVDEVLSLLDQARSDVSGTSPHHLHSLRFAMIEDFESDIGPEITRLLASALPNCRFTLYTRMSHEILDLLRNRDVDIGIATQPQTPMANLIETPLLRDPFVLAVPAHSTHSAEEFVQGQSGLPFLRYMSSQIMGSMIEAQLSRLRIKLGNTHELDSTSSIMALVAQNSGWAITTPSNYARGQRFHAQIKLLPFPRKGFARRISMFVGDPDMSDLAQTILMALRSQLSTHSIGPTHAAYPWLRENYRLITD